MRSSVLRPSPVETLSGSSAAGVGQNVETVEPLNPPTGRRWA